jgi:hypothetical protein
MEGKRSAMVISGLQNDPCSTLPLTNSTGEGMSLTIRYPSTVHLFSLLGLLLMLLVASPASSLSIEGAQRVIQPQLVVQTDLNVAELLFHFEEILLGKGFRITSHVCQPWREEFIFEFEVAPNLVGEMILRYESVPKALWFETARFEEDWPMDESYFREITDRLLNGIILEIERRLR